MGKTRLGGHSAFFPPNSPCRRGNEVLTTAAKERPKSGKEHNFYFPPALPTGLAKKEHKIATAVEKSQNYVPVSTDVSISH